MDDNDQSQSFFPHVSDNAESQSTQLLDFVLGRTTTAAPTKAWNDTPAKGSPSSSGSAHGNKSDVDASASGASDVSLASSVHYHFHGLAETQTQSEPHEGTDEAEEGGSESQKENTPTHVVSVPKTPTPPTLEGEAKTGAVAFCVQDKKEKAPIALPLTPSRPLSTRAPPPQVPQTKVVSFLSPLKRPSPKPDRVQKATPAPMRFRRRTRQQRSPSPASQDSFAGPNPLEDPDLFLATARQFAIPIDQIGQHYSQEDEESQEPQGGAQEETQPQEQQKSHVEESPLKDEKQQMGPPARSVSQMTPYSLSSASSNRFGRILVANSDSSTGPSQDSNEHLSQDNNSMQMSQQPTQVLDESVTTSMVVQVDEDEVHEGDQTQIIDESTQPSDFPMSVDVPPANNIQRTSTAGTTGSAFPPSNATSTASGPRSLLASIAPEKRHRYAHIEPPRALNIGQGSPFIPPSLLQGVDRNAQTNAGISVAATETGKVSTISGISKAATAGTSVASVVRVPAPAVNLSSANVNGQEPDQPVKSVGVKRPRRSDYDEDVIPDSEAQVEEQLSSQRSTKPAPIEDNPRKKPLEVILESEPEDLTPLPSPEPSKVVDGCDGLTEEESEEEEPLSKQRRAVKKAQPTPPAQVRAKGKQREIVPLPVAGRTRASAAPAAAPAKQEKKPIQAPPPAVPLAVTRAKRKAAEMLEVVPSSEPQNDAVALRRKSARGAKNKGKGPLSALAAAPQQQRTASPAGRKVRGGTRARASTFELPSPATPSASHSHSEEERTEIADDERMDEDDIKTMDGDNVDEDSDEEKSETAVAIPTPGTVPLSSPELANEPSRKRLRGAPAPTASLSTLPSPGKRRTTRKTAASTRRTTTTKTTASASKSAKRTSKATGSVTKGTRVLALWKYDAYWYIGTVHSVNGELYKIKYDDGSEDDLFAFQLRKANDIKEGDIITPYGYSLSARVTRTDAWQSDNVLQAVIVGGQDDGIEVDVEARKLKVPSRTILGQWNDRKLSPDEIIPTIGRKALSPSKLSTLSAAAHYKVFSQYGFIITLGPTVEKYEVARANIVRSINELGGTVIDDWSDILAFQGRHVKGDKRWIIDASDIKLTQPKGVDRVFLISNMCTQKAKYLIALALGVPCMSDNWLVDMEVGVTKPWEIYLLPAGFSESFNARISQIIDLDWGNSPLHLQDIMNNLVSVKILQDANVLCLGPELLPPKKPPTDASVGAHFVVPRIVACMGARRVEAVASVEHASERDLSQYDFVVVKDSPPSSLTETAVCVNVSWIKDCLITGRQLPLPTFT